MFRLAIPAATLAALVNINAVKAQNEIPYSACPLIGAYYTAPSLAKDSEEVATINSIFTEAFDNLIADGGSDVYGPIFNETTSFSFALFSGGESVKDRSIFFEYHYTSPTDQSSLGTNVTRDTKFPLGDVTMVFTVYAWLMEVGDSWETPITQYLPELLSLDGDDAEVRWDEVTIGALAGHMSGIIRKSDACEVTADCNFDAFMESLTQDAFLFHPDTTPIVSYAAYQLLAFAMQRQSGASDFSSVMSASVFQPLGMTGSGLLSDNPDDVFAIQDFNATQKGEEGALALFSSVADLARAGHSMLDSTLLSPAVTRRWLRVSSDTSNLRNGVGRPWEIYRSGRTPISPVVPALTKSGTIAQYASYFGMVPELNTGFAILAYDSTVRDRKLDLNVHADIASEAIAHLIGFAAQEMALRFGGEYRGTNGNGTVAVFDITENGPGLAVQELRIAGVDVKAQFAAQLNIEAANVDFRLYPTNVQSDTKHQFVGVFQDVTALIDAGTPTCITWQDVGAFVEHRVVFQLGEDGMASGFEILGQDVSLERDM